MDFKKGDKVKFLNEAGGGSIVSVSDTGNAMVQIDDGFEIPVPVSQLIKTESSGENEARGVVRHPEVQKTTKAPQQQPLALKVRKLAKAYLALVPQTEKFDKDDFSIDIYLLNDGDLFLYYIFSTEKHQRLSVVEKGDLETETKVKLGTFKYTELIKLESLTIDFLVYSEAAFEYHKPMYLRVDLNNLNLKRAIMYQENEYFYEKAMLLDVSLPTQQQNEPDTTKVKAADKTTANVKNTDIEEVDLHIEAILENFATLQPGEILETQMARFTTSLEGAIKAKTKKIVFIHGVGNGKLRYELRKTLETKYRDLNFQDASFAEYGYGATMVMIR